MDRSESVSRRGLLRLGVARVTTDLDAPLTPRRPPPDPRQAYARRQTDAWGAGDGAGLWDGAARRLVDAAAPAAGQRVLDAGAGSGNVALRAARCGAQVDALELSAGLVAKGEARTEAAAAAVSWHQGDMARLPFADATFDHVLSGLAPMFCLRAREATAELFRVVRPGGTVAFSVWTRSGIVGRALQLAAEHDPPPPGLPRPLSWGREENLRVELERHADASRNELVDLPLDLGPPEEATERLMRDLGPLAAAASSDGLADAVGAVADELSGRPQGLTAGCLITVARRPGG